MKRLAIEVIPVNPATTQQGTIPLHLGRLNWLAQSGMMEVTQVFLVYIADKEGMGDPVLQRSIGDLQGSITYFFNLPTPIIRQIRPEFPELAEDLETFRAFLEGNYQGCDVFFNTTPLPLHYLAVVLKDALTSARYNFLPYEIIDPSVDRFKWQVIPSLKDLDIVDWAIITLLAKRPSENMNLKTILELVEAPTWNPGLATADQKMRLKLGELVNKGIIGSTMGRGAEKFYFLKVSLPDLRIPLPLREQNL